MWDRQTDRDRERDRYIQRQRERDHSAAKVRYDSIQPKFLLSTNVGHQPIINALCKAAIIHSASYSTRAQWVCSV